MDRLHDLVAKMRSPAPLRFDRGRLRTRGSSGLQNRRRAIENDVENDGISFRLDLQSRSRLKRAYSGFFRPGGGQSASHRQLPRKSLRVTFVRERGGSARAFPSSACRVREPAARVASVLVRPPERCANPETYAAPEGREPRGRAKVGGLASLEATDANDDREESRALPQRSTASFDEGRAW